MRSLTVRIFLSFWLIIVILTGLAAAAGYSYAQRLREAFENFEANDTALAASEILQANGRAGLEQWLNDLVPGSPLDVFVVDDEGRDILGRRLPFHVARLLRRFGGNRHDRRNPRHRFPDWRRDDAPNLRPARPITRIIGPDGDVYSLFVSPKRNPYGEWIVERAGPAFLLIALLVSGAVSLFLARAIARPVQRFREATVSIAEGKLDTRVAASMRNRRDEIGMLAHDLDAMATRLQDAADQQVELTRNISHELRSPLARLRVALELARRRAGDLPELARIYKETERLDELIGQILSYSRMDALGDETPGAFDVGELLRDVVDNVNYECRSSGIESVAVQLSSGEGLVVNGYGAALTSALENVLRNAIRHSPTGGIVSVDVSATAGNVTIEISDRGAGVPEGALDRLFEPFYRSESDTGEPAPGTGLGLAIAKRAIEKNGGSISARNVDGGGLRVSIILPLPV